jgi:hypothetical protein
VRNPISTLELIFSYFATGSGEAVSGIFLPHNKDQFNAHIGYWRTLGSSDDFAGQTLAHCVEIIHTDIVGVWNLPDKDGVRPFILSGLSCLLKKISACQSQRSRM